MKRVLLTLSLLGVLLLSGCAFLNSLLGAAFQKPTLTFKTANLRDLSLTGTTVDLVFTLDNPNSFGLTLQDVDYAFSLEGRPVVAGRPPNGLTLPAAGSQDLTFPATVRFEDLAPTLEVFLNKDVAHYHAEGHIGVQTPVGVISFPLSKDGQFDVPKVPTVQLGSPRVTSVSFAGVSVEVPVTLTNRNNFALPLGGVNGALQVGGADVGTVSTGDVGALPARGARSFTLPLSLRAGSTGRILAALSGGATSVGVRGTFQAGGRGIPFSLSQQLKFER